MKRYNWRNILARLPLPTLALAAAWGVGSFAALFVPLPIAIIQAAAFELTYLGLAIVEVPERVRRRRATRISLSAVAVSVVYNSAAGYFHRNPQALIGLSFPEELALAVAHGAPLAIVAYLVADLLFHTRTVPRSHLFAQRRGLVRRLIHEVRMVREMLAMTGKQLAEKGNRLLSTEDDLRNQVAESARLADLIHMAEAKYAEAREEVRKERETTTRLSAQVRTKEVEGAELERQYLAKSAEVDALSASSALDVRSIAQTLRDRGVALRTIADALSVSEKTIRNWTVEQVTNGRHP